MAKEPQGGSIIPRTWSEARPAVVWAVIIAGFGVVFAESIGQLIQNPLWRAAMSLAVIFGLIAVLIHWRQIRESMPLAYAFGVAVIVVAASPYVGLLPLPKNADQATSGAQGFTQQQVTAKVAEATAPLNSAIASLNQQMQFKEHRLATLDQEIADQDKLSVLRGVVPQLSPSDKERLANAFFEFSGAIDDQAHLWQAISKEGAEIRDDAGSGKIPDTYQQHIDRLQALATSAQEKRQLLQGVLDKWKFYSPEEDYVFGGYNPDAIGNAAAEWLKAFQLWEKIANRQDVILTRDFLWYPQIRADDFISIAARWQNAASQRLDKIKALLP